MLPWNPNALCPFNLIDEGKLFDSTETEDTVPPSMQLRLAVLKYLTLILDQPGISTLLSGEAKWGN